MLDWIFEGMVKWISSVVTKLMDAISGLFLKTLGTDMLAMEEYFPFVGKAFVVIQYFAWALLFLITIWQLFRAFGGNITEAENPIYLILRAALFAVLIYYAKPIFLYVLKIAKAPYSALMDVPMGSEAFTFAGIEQALRNGLVKILSDLSVVGAILITVLMIALGWNYFKLLLEVVERYIVVGVLCYTSPLAFSMGASKNTSQVFKSWCRMVGSQLLLLVMNVWFLRAFNSSAGQYIGSGGSLSNGSGSVFLWLFCALAFLKTAQKFDSYLASIGLSVAQTGSGLGMELLVATRLVTGMAGGAIKGSGFMGKGPVSGGGLLSGFANKFKGNSYVRDAVTQGGQRMGAGGLTGVIGRAFGGVAAKNGAKLTSNSISSVASKSPKFSGNINGNIADSSLQNYLPNLKGKTLSDTNISGGHISTSALAADGTKTMLDFYKTDQFDRPDGAHAIVTAADGSTWYQTASGKGSEEFFDTPQFSGRIQESAKIAEAFPSISEGTRLRTVDDGKIESIGENGNSLWYSSAYYDEPNAPHSIITGADGLDWYAMKPAASVPEFETGDEAREYNAAVFSEFMSGYNNDVHHINAEDSSIEVIHSDGSGTRFYDASQYNRPRGNFETYEDVDGNMWYAINGTSAVECRPVYDNGSPVYDGDNVKTVSVATVRYNGAPSKYGEPVARDVNHGKSPKRKI